MKKAVFC